ncbi:MAG: hypothetical protein Q8P24_00165 [Desulfobacterales bacterium]|nr:hypothetical protein [Desulfobacterales bacterium]
MTRKKLRFCLFLTLLVGLTACNKDASETQPPAPAAAQTPASVQAPAEPRPQTAVNQGKVVEKFDAGSYTFIRLEDGAGNTLWAAAPQTTLEVGEEIVLNGGSVMHNFTSKSLNRTFESIIFATGVTRNSPNLSAQAPEVSAQDLSPVAGSQAAPGEMAAQPSSQGSAGAMAPFSGLAVEKATAPNGYTVAELFANATRLNQQKVTVRGKVVKFSANIMGKNWLHIQDGTGDPAKKNHDLVVTSSSVVNNNDLVLLEGVLASDKDFGFGYNYSVIVEDAVVVK